MGHAQRLNPIAKAAALQELAPKAKSPKWITTRKALEGQVHWAKLELRLAEERQKVREAHALIVLPKRRKPASHDLALKERDMNRDELKQDILDSIDKAVPENVDLDGDTFDDVKDAVEETIDQAVAAVDADVEEEGEDRVAEDAQDGSVLDEKPLIEN